MFFLRLTLYTCVFYCAIALPLIIADLIIEFWTSGGFGIHFHGRVGFSVFAGFWGLIWLASFLFAFRVAFGPQVWNHWLNR
jgi:hypothetical protein